MAFEYGIMQELSDWRVHVCFGEGFAYLFKTDAGREACDSGTYRKLPAFQPGVDGATAYGYVVPPMDIRGCKRIEIPEGIQAPSPKDTTSAKGRAAERCAQEMFRRGLLPIEIETSFITDENVQMQGIDIVVKDRARIEIKCDYAGGVDGTGNLYLQISERNPLGRH